MRYRLLLVICLILIHCFAPAAPSEPTFRFHLSTEPHSLDPVRISRAEAGTFYGLLMRPLLKISADGELSPDVARACRFERSAKEAASNRAVVCSLRTTRWSNHQLVTAQDFVRGFQHLLSGQAKNPGADLLMSLKNAKLVFVGQLAAEKLGVSAVDSSTLRFELNEPDPEFLYKLASNLLVPLPAQPLPDREHSQELVVNGPYKIESWKVGHRLKLIANLEYESTSTPKSARPPVEILFIDDEETALNLYLNGDLNFLRNLPTTYIPKYKARSDFVQIPQTRFDYVGFGPELEPSLELRKAFSLAADYRELQVIYNALGIPGCPSLPESTMDHPHCVSFNLAKAKEALSHVAPTDKLKRYKFMFSKTLTSDLKKGAEWFQAQWKKNLGITIDLDQAEQGVFLQTLKEAPPALFRRAVVMDRPTCLAAMEAFAANSPENYVHFKDSVFETGLAALKKASEVTIIEKKTAPSREARIACGKLVQRLLDRAALIPLGRIHFTMLVDPKFKGWTINEVNQLDLSELRFEPGH